MCVRIVRKVNGHIATIQENVKSVVLLVNIEIISVLRLLVEIAATPKSLVYNVNFVLLVDGGLNPMEQ